MRNWIAISIGLALLLGVTAQQSAFHDQPLGYPKHICPTADDFYIAYRTDQVCLLSLRQRACLCCQIRVSQCI